ncbi:MAG: hypothetical protein IH840_17515, partial [Candidatus Heimdallarchaeota archaeon]|nr:hypothetical protein [Candidatus Heimdallarchaeota archaeon]
MSASQNFAMDQAALAFGSYLREQKPYETFGVFLTVIWLFAGLFSSEFLYLISMTLSAGIFVISSLVKLDPRKRAISVIHTSSFRRLIVAFIANWGYTSGRTGDSEIDFFSFIIPINEIASLVIVVLFIIWMATKYAEAIDRNGFDFIRTPLLFLRGFLRSIILVAVLYSVVTRGNGPDISEQLQEPIVLAFIIEPFVYVIYSEFNQSRSTSDMVLGDSRLPAVALRESFLTNLVMIFMLFWFKGVSGPEWEFLRAVYVIGFFFTLFSSLQSIKDYNTNPLGKGNLANFLNDTPSHLENFDLDSKIGHVIDEVTNLSLGNDSDLKISKGSVVIPIAGHKKTISALSVGQTESIISDGSEKIAEMNDGITTAIISKKDFEKVTKILKQELPKYQEESLSFYEKLHLYNLFVDYYFFIQDFKKGCIHAQKW